MREAILAGDEELGQRAVAAAQELIRSLGHAVRRSQIKGLLALVGTEPDKIAEFAGVQRERAVKRAEGGKQRSQDEASFWEIVADLCKGTRPRHEWSLNQALEAAVPAELKVPALPPGAKLSKQDQEQRKRLQEAEKRWKQAWFAAHAAVFFRRFCVEYLKDMPDDRENDE